MERDVQFIATSTIWDAKLVTVPMYMYIMVFPGKSLICSGARIWE